RPRLQRRFFAWIGRNRRLAKDFEASIDSARAFLYGGRCPWRAADTAPSRAIPPRSHRSGSANRCGYSACGWLGSTWHLRIGVNNRSESCRLQSLNPFETASKSRLTAALLERVASEPHTRLRYFCSPQHADSAFFPIISQMERAAGFTHADTTQAKLDKLDAMLALASTSKQDAALFAEMLSLPNDGRYPTLELTPQQ